MRTAGRSAPSTPAMGAISLKTVLSVIKDMGSGPYDCCSCSAALNGRYTMETVKEQAKNGDCLKIFAMQIETAPTLSIFR